VGISVGHLLMAAGPQASHPLKYVVGAGTASLERRREPQEHHLCIIPITQRGATPRARALHRAV